MKNNSENKNHSYNMSFDNLAIPEVHIPRADAADKVSQDEPVQGAEDKTTVVYDEVAIPEIHVKRKI